MGRFQSSFYICASLRVSQLISPDNYPIPPYLVSKKTPRMCIIFFRMGYRTKRSSIGYGEVRAVPIHSLLKRRINSWGTLVTKPWSRSLNSFSEFKITFFFYHISYFLWTGGLKNLNLSQKKYLEGNRNMYFKVFYYQPNHNCTIQLFRNISMHIKNKSYLN